MGIRWVGCSAGAWWPLRKVMATTIYIDADGCPVKGETYKVARRYQLAVRVVANRRIQVPLSPLVEAVVVGNALDEADDWIVEQAATGDIVITADIPLAARSLKKGARVLGPKGRVFTEDSIGEALAHREILSHIRDTGTITKGPAPFQPKDRSRFLQRLDEIIVAVQRGK